ncbi:MAG: fibrinogen-like YCDxxxxGGGW domain-containing protein, partial [Myxococcota bacterium]|nr:fibrinogen-like YCDxxxxGGGW domain-containing protein [Myxococcota bacterium]
QGLLRDNAGTLVAEDVFGMTFALYPAADAQVPVWTETRPAEGQNCGQNPEACVQVLDGIFRVSLGAVEPLPVSVLEGGSLWLGVTVETDPELPRRPLGSAPYALHAGSATALSCTGCVGYGQLGPDVTSVIENVVITEQGMPPTGLDEVSGGLLSNEEHYVWAAAESMEILDQFPPGSTSSIDVPSEGPLLDLKVAVHLTNSDLSTVKVTLVDPNGGVFVLWDGDDAGETLETTWPTPQPLLAGDLLATWVGQDAVGTWTLEVVDTGFLNNGIDGQVLGWQLQAAVRSESRVQATSDLAVAGDLFVGGQANVEGDLVVSGAIGGPGGIVIGEGAGACDAAQNGALSYDPDLKRLFLCVGDEVLKLKACSTVCPEPGEVACGETLADSCGDPCPDEATGTGVNTTQCLVNASGTGCNIPVVDGCGNDCGLLGSDLNLDTCADPIAVPCDQPIIDPCGNTCGNVGEGLNLGQCPAPQGAVCGASLVDSCGNACGMTGEACDGIAVCVGGACRVLGQDPDYPVLSCKHALESWVSQGSGAYWVDWDGDGAEPATEVYCDMDQSGGGWALLLNLDSGDGDRKDYTRTDFWAEPGVLGATAAPFASDYKGESFSAMTGHSEVLLVAHNQGTLLGHSTYTLLPEHAGKSLLFMLTNNTHVAITGAPNSQSGATGAV